MVLSHFYFCPGNYDVLAQDTRTALLNGVHQWPLGLYSPGWVWESASTTNAGHGSKCYYWRDMLIDSRTAIATGDNVLSYTLGLSSLFLRYSHSQHWQWMPVAETFYINSTMTVHPPHQFHHYYIRNACGLPCNLISVDVLTINWRYCPQ